MMMRIKQTPLLKALAVVMTIGSLTVGCSGVADKDDILKSARDAVAKAESNSSVAKYAPVTLHDAQQALSKAETAKDAKEMENAAYLAKRQAETAMVEAEGKQTEQERQALVRQQDKVLLQSREREAEKARAEAEAKSKELDAKAKELQAEREKLAAEREKIRLLQEQLADLQAKQTDRGMEITLGEGVLFETAKADLLEGALPKLDKIANVLVQNPKRNVLIEGHTDNVGGEDYNMGLSQRRADAVRLALVERGVNATRTLAKGYGKSRPVASNDSPSGRQQNRRVEITILNEGEMLR